MTEYKVAWLIEIDADSPREAAEIARKIQQDPNSQADTFHVKAYDGMFKYDHVEEWEEIDTVVRKTST